MKEKEKRKKCSVPFPSPGVYLFHPGRIPFYNSDSYLFPFGNVYLFLLGTSGGDVAATPNVLLAPASPLLGYRAPRVCKAVRRPP